VTREEVVRAITDAPTKVVVSLALTVLVALGGWVWTIADDVSDQRAAVAVAAEQARAATIAQDRIEQKLDRLIEVVADLRAEIARTRRAVQDREKNR
jgi:hypothetical protein